MGCGSSKVAVSTVLVNGTQDGAILKDANENITQSKPIGSNEKERLGSQLGSSNRLGPVESLGIFRKRKKNLYQSLDVFEQIDQRSVTVGFFRNFCGFPFHFYKTLFSVLLYIF